MAAHLRDERRLLRPELVPVRRAMRTSTGGWLVRSPPDDGLGERGTKASAEARSGPLPTLAHICRRRVRWPGSGGIRDRVKGLNRS